MNNILKANQEFKELVMEYNSKSEELLMLLKKEGKVSHDTEEPEQIVELQKVYKRKIAVLKSKYGLM